MVELQEGCSNKHKRLNKKVYEKELAKLQTELVCRGPEAREDRSNG